MASKGTRRRSKFECLDCGEDTGRLNEFYFVETGLWLSAVGSREGMLCVGCLEKRLGRRLIASDFPDVVVNRVGPGAFGRKSDRLLSRLRDRAGIYPHGNR